LLCWEGDGGKGWFERILPVGNAGAGKRNAKQRDGTDP